MTWPLSLLVILAPVNLQRLTYAMAVLPNASGLAVKTSESDSGHDFSVSMLAVFYCSKADDANLKDFLQVMVIAGIYMVCVIVLLSYVIQ